MFATGETVGLAEWIIDDTCLVKYKIDQHCRKEHQFPTSICIVT